ncbi:MAG: hypothetical protein KatS3mg100_123 [Candidatus Parcubacteria bacterium]|nr:MAG: hypothetical protein KatS3mg100_123 [Candidatus Parcubacteria bacterium]
MEDRFKKALRDPRKALRALWRRGMNRTLNLILPFVAPLRGGGKGGVMRHYASPKIYCAHQQFKLYLLRDYLQEEYEPRFESALFERLQHLREQGVLKRKGVALCLAARLGAEVRAFRRAGFFAVGIDLNPGKRNPWVLPGDFHNLQFADESVDVVYSNSLDHVLDLPQFTREVRRVLKDEGVALFEVMKGLQEGGRMGAFEARMWSSVDALQQELRQFGLSCAQQGEFDYPWRGVILVCRQMNNNETTPARA